MSALDAPGIRYERRAQEKRDIIQDAFHSRREGYPAGK